MKTIESRQNPLVKRLRAAVREHADEIVVEGPKQVADAIASGWIPIAVALRDGSRWDAPAAAPPRAILSPGAFDSVSDTRASQGVLALFERPHATASAIFARHSSIAIVLDGVQDPGNVGTIVRLAAAFDAAGVLLLPGCADAFAPKAIRASAGAALHVAIAATTAAELLGCGLPLFAADAGGDPVDPPSRGAVLVFGSEGAGPSPEILRIAARIAVPMSPGVESLNVASSAAILLARSYEIRVSSSAPSP